MSLPNRSTKLKVAFGYILLTALLFISIGYIYQEMKSLSGTGDDEATGANGAMSPIRLSASFIRRKLSDNHSVQDN
jgi:hypothetical protein